MAGNEVNRQADAQKNSQMENQQDHIPALPRGEPPLGIRSPLLGQSAPALQFMKPLGTNSLTVIDPSFYRARESIQPVRFDHSFDHSLDYGFNDLPFFDDSAHRSNQPALRSAQSTLKLPNQPVAQRQTQQTINSFFGPSISAPKAIRSSTSTPASGKVETATTQYNLHQNTSSSDLSGTSRHELSDTLTSATTSAPISAIELKPENSTASSPLDRTTASPTLPSASLSLNPKTQSDVSPAPADTLQSKKDFAEANEILRSQTTDERQPGSDLATRQIPKTQSVPDVQLVSETQSVAETQLDSEVQPVSDPQSVLETQPVLDTQPATRTQPTLKSPDQPVAQRQTQRTINPLSRQSIPASEAIRSSTSTPTSDEAEIAPTQYALHQNTSSLDLSGTLSQTTDKHQPSSKTQPDAEALPDSVVQLAPNIQQVPDAQSIQSDLDTRQISKTQSVPDVQLVSETQSVAEIQSDTEVQPVSESQSVLETQPGLDTQSATRTQPGLDTQSATRTQPTLKSPDQPVAQRQAQQTINPLSRQSILASEAIRSSTSTPTSDEAEIAPTQYALHQNTSSSDTSQYELSDTSTSAPTSTPISAIEPKPENSTASSPLDRTTSSPALPSASLSLNPKTQSDISPTPADTLQSKKDFAEANEISRSQTTDERQPSSETQPDAETLPDSVVQLAPNIQQVPDAQSIQSDLDAHQTPKTQSVPDVQPVLKTQSDTEVQPVSEPQSVLETQSVTETQSATRTQPTLKSPDQPVAQRQTQQTINPLSRQSIPASEAIRSSTSTPTSDEAEIAPTQYALHQNTSSLDLSGTLSQTTDKRQPSSETQPNAEALPDSIVQLAPNIQQVPDAQSIQPDLDAHQTPKTQSVPDVQPVLKTQSVAETQLDSEVQSVSEPQSVLETQPVLNAQSVTEVQPTLKSQPDLAAQSTLDTQPSCHHPNDPTLIQAESISSPLAETQENSQSQNKRSEQRSETPFQTAATPDIQAKLLNNLQDSNNAPFTESSPPTESSFAEPPPTELPITADESIEPSSTRTAANITDSVRDISSVSEQSTPSKRPISESAISSVSVQLSSQPSAAPSQNTASPIQKTDEPLIAKVAEQLESVPHTDSAPQAAENRSPRAEGETAAFSEETQQLSQPASATSLSTEPAPSSTESLPAYIAPDSTNSLIQPFRNNTNSKIDSQFNISRNNTEDSNIEDSNTEGKNIEDDGIATQQQVFLLPTVLQSLGQIAPLNSVQPLLQPSKNADPTPSINLSSPDTSTTPTPPSMPPSMPTPPTETPDNWGSIVDLLEQTVASQPQESQTQDPQLQKSQLQASEASKNIHPSAIPKSPPTANSAPEPNSIYSAIADPIVQPRLESDTQMQASPSSLYPDLQPFSVPPSIQKKQTTASSLQRLSNEPAPSSPPNTPSPNTSDDDSNQASESEDNPPSPEQLEQLAQAIYQQVRQRLILERERIGSSHSGRLR